MQCATTLTNCTGQRLCTSAIWGPSDSNSNFCGMQMADGARELQESVVRLCSLWWHKELPGRDHLVPQMIPYLLYQATVSGANTAQPPA